MQQGRRNRQGRKIVALAFPGTLTFIGGYNLLASIARLRAGNSDTTLVGVVLCISVVMLAIGIALLRRRARRFDAENPP